MKKTKTRRRLRPWVKNTIKGIAFIVVSGAIALGLMCAMTEAHYQRVEYWNEVGGY